MQVYQSRTIDKKYLQSVKQARKINRRESCVLYDCLFYIQSRASTSLLFAGVLATPLQRAVMESTEIRLTETLWKAELRIISYFTTFSTLHKIVGLKLIIWPVQRVENKEATDNN